MAKGSGNAITLPNLPSSAGNVGNINAGLSANNLYPGLTPQATGIAQSVAGGPYNAQALAGAEKGAGIASDTATGAAGLSKSLVPYATDILQTGFDPQGDLYKRTLDQTQQGERAAESARGIAMTPYGAGLEGDVTKNFNIDWQNNLLNRQTQAAQGASGLADTSFNLGSGASSLAQQGASMPAKTNADLGSMAMNALDALAGFAGKGAAIPQEQITNLLNYLGLAPSFAQAQTASNDAQNPFMAIAPIAGQAIGGWAGK